MDIVIRLRPLKIAPIFYEIIIIDYRYGIHHNIIYNACLASIIAMSDITIGSNVSVTKKRGTVRFIGETQFAPGEWIGIELLESLGGKNDGSVDGVRYFETIQTAENYGLFVRRNQCKSCDYSSKWQEQNDSPIIFVSDRSINIDGEYVSSSSDKEAMEDVERFWAQFGILVAECR